MPLPTFCGDNVGQLDLGHIGPRTGFAAPGTTAAGYSSIQRASSSNFAVFAAIRRASLSNFSLRSLMWAELSRPSAVYAGAMLVAVTCPQCRHLGFIPKHMLTRSLICSSCGTRAQVEGGEDAGRAIFTLMYNEPQPACGGPENNRERSGWRSAH